MEDPKQRLTTCVSTPELERRWKAVREQMKARKIDYLVMQNSEEYMGGTLRWFTDFTARHQFPMSVIFPVDDEMTTIVCGNDPPLDNWPPPFSSRGIKKKLGHVYFSTHYFTKYYDGELAVSVLKEKKNPVICWVERTTIPVTFHEYLVKNLPGATFVDATDWLDEIRVPKSPEEIELIRRCASMQDACMEALKKIIKPGMRDMDVYAEAHCFLSRHGSERGLVQVGSGPLGTFVPFDVPHFQNRTIQEGDQVTVLVEVNGPGGYYTELMRAYCVGAEPTQALKDAQAAGLEAQDMTVKALVTGGVPGDMWKNFGQFCIQHGYAPPTRSFGHGQGQSLVDRPSLRPDEPWTIKPNTNIAVHPIMVKPGTVFCPSCDNYLTTEGAAERLHQFPRGLVVI